VSRGLIANSQLEYRRLGAVISYGRLAGAIDWEAIEDRTRGLRSPPVWSSPENIVEAASRQFRLDVWADQPLRVEVWAEKEALAGVFLHACDALRVPYLSCRGYVSQSELWRAARRLRSYVEAGQDVIVLYFGDHDPSGLDMTRDIEDRLRRFDCAAGVRRLALNIDQVRKYNPPPNPAKMTDSRIGGYLEEFGDQSWELDALEPRLLSALVADELSGLMDNEAWNARVSEEVEARGELSLVASRWKQAVRGARRRTKKQDRG